MARFSLIIVFMVFSLIAWNLRKKSNGVSKAMREREKGFCTSAADAEVPAYNSLYDQDLRHYFDNR